MPADAPVTILSSGRAGSVLRAHVDLSVPLQAAEEEEAAGSGGEGAAAGKSPAEEGELEAAAAALFDAMRTSEFSFGEDEGGEDEEENAMDEDGEKKKGKGAPKWLEEKLLAARRRVSSSSAPAVAGSSSASPPTSEADLHLALTLARLFALSHGESVLRREHWEGVERLEEARRARIAKAAAGGAN